MTGLLRFEPLFEGNDPRFERSDDAENLLGKLHVFDLEAALVVEGRCYVDGETTSDRPRFGQVEECSVEAVEELFVDASCFGAALDGDVHSHTVPPVVPSDESLEEEVREHRMRDSFGGYDWGDPIVLWTWPRRAPFRFTLEQLAIAERVLASVGGDVDAEVAERGADVSSPVLEILDAAEEFDGGAVELERKVFGLGRDGAGGGLWAHAEAFGGAEDGLFEVGEESGVDGGHGRTIATATDTRERSSRIAGDAA